MNRRSFFRLVMGALAIAVFRKKLHPEPVLTPERQKYPAHECVDRPYLPCPACLKAEVDL